MTSLPFDIDIAERAGLWGDYKDLIFASIQAALGVLDSPRLSELSIVLSDNEQVKALNRDYRGKNKPTNVLSFPISPPAPMLGDIVLAYETVVKEADEKGVAFEAHMMHLLIHGFLHLQGYDHEEESDAEVMEGLEIKALRTLNVANPYV
jgi:probable rRNA maturation factor